MTAQALMAQGTAAFGRGDVQAALADFTRVLAIDPRHVDALNNRGLMLGRLNQLPAALDSFAQVMQLEPDNVFALFNGAVALANLGRLEAALEQFTRTTALDPNHVEAWTFGGLALKLLKRPAEAADCLERALRLDPDHVPALSTLVQLEAERGRVQQAEAWASKLQAIQAAPVQALLRSGNTLLALGRYEEASQRFSQLLQLKPDHAEAWSRHGACLGHLRRYEEALDSFERAVQLDPRNAGAWCDRGTALQHLHRQLQAMDSFERCLSLDPHHIDGLTGRGAALWHLDRLDQALACYTQALSLDPAHAQAVANRGLVRLARGELPQGFRDQEARWDTPTLKPHRPRCATPRWLGEAPLAGKTLLLIHEQGLGDTLQFVRYATLAAQQGARVILRVPEALRELLRSVEGVAEVVGTGDPWPEHELHCPIMSLPLAFGTTLDTIPGTVPYLRAEPARVAAWSKRLGPRTRPRIGLVWAGRQYSPINYPRDMALASLRPLLELDLEFVSLQKELPQPDLETLASLPQLLRHGETVDDFADTAALIANLDLVLAVDTSVVHLAGALGKPVWLMNRHAACWRWLRGRDDTPWYPNLRQFRQTRYGDWDGVVQSIRQALAESPLPLAEAAAERRVRAAPPASAALSESAPLTSPITSSGTGPAPPPAGEADQTPAARAAETERLLHQGIAAAEQGRFEDALTQFHQLLAQHPDHVEALYRSGRAAAALQRHQQALNCFTRVLALDPQHQDALHNRGAALASQFRFGEALDCFDRVLAANPDSVAALSNRAYCLNHLYRHDQALAALERALQLDPRHLGAWVNRASALLSLNRPQESLHCCDQALRLDPRHAGALAGRGAALEYLDRPDQALACYEQSLNLDPEQGQTVSNRGLVRLALGDLPRGFRDQERRWDTAELRPNRPRSGAPLWLGQTPLQGKTLLLIHEQGLGDTLQFVRYAALAARQGARVILRVPQALCELLRSVEGVTQVLSTADPWPEHDLHCPMMSLPLAFGTTLQTIPGSTPYLHADAARVSAWSAQLGPKTRPRIGLVWAGRQYPPINYRRDMTLAQLRPLFEAETGVELEFISLQKELPQPDLDLLATLPQLARHGEAVSDFADTAALIANLDLVLAVDTAVVHLAGALGKPVWLMNRYASCWRWLRGRDDSPWYPSLRQFRQSTLGDWDGVVRNLRQALLESPLPLGEAAAQRRVRAALSASAAARESAPLSPAPLPEGEGIRSSVPARPDSAEIEALLRRGIAAAEQGRFDQARAHFREVLARRPDHVQALYLDGRSAAALGDQEEALDCFNRVLELDPRHLDALNNRGAILARHSRLAEALDCFDRVLAIQADFVPALSNRGYCLNNLHRHQEALATSEQALRLDPGHTGALVNRSGALLNLDRPLEALASSDEALRLNPRDPGALAARAAALGSLDRFEEALQCYEQVLRSNPSAAQAAQAVDKRGLIRLALGDLPQGFRDQEARWDKPALRPHQPRCTTPLWLGETPLQGKTLLLIHEQGLGDTLQMVRYALAAAQQGARVILRVPETLRELLRSADGVAQVVGMNDPWPEHDLHCPIMSLPLAFGTTLDTIPGKVPYLHADAARVSAWSDRLGRGTRPRIGLAWAGLQQPPINYPRDMALALLRPLLGLEFEFISLQKDVPRGDLETLAGLPQLARHGETLNDFADTAALIANLDLVLAVDTSVVHLAGALGKPVWLMNRYASCWRWLRGRDDTPWYPTLRQFRQATLGDWETVVQRVGQALAELHSST